MASASLIGYYIFYFILRTTTNNTMLSIMKINCFKANGETLFLNVYLTFIFSLNTYGLYSWYQRYNTRKEEKSTSLLMKNYALLYWTIFFIMISLIAIIANNLIHWQYDIGYCIYTLDMIIYYLFFPYMIYISLLTDSNYWKTIVGVDLNQAQLLFLKSLDTISSIDNPNNDEFINKYKELIEGDDINSIYNQSSDLRTFLIQNSTKCIAYSSLTKIKNIGTGTFSIVDLYSYQNMLVTCKQYRLQQYSLDVINYLETFSRETTSLFHLQTSDYIVKVYGLVLIYHH